MNRILSLQMMESTGFEKLGMNFDSLGETSATSFPDCICSTASCQACPTTDVVIAQ